MSALGLSGVGMYRPWPPRRRHRQRSQQRHHRRIPCGKSPLQSQLRNEKHGQEEREAGRETLCILPSDPETISFDECAEVRRRDVTGGLWVSRWLSWLGTQGRGEDHRWRNVGGPFFPALSCDCGGSCTVSKSTTWPSSCSGGHTEASLKLLGVRAEGAEAFSFIT